MARGFANKDNRLVQWLQDQGMRQGDFAQQLGTYQTTISRICRAQLIPSLEMAVRIEDATDGAVSHRYWLELHGLIEAEPQEGDDDDDEEDRGEQTQAHARA